MKTPTHLAMTWLASRALGLPAAESRLLVMGACLPDLPVTLVGVVVAITPSGGMAFVDRMSALYFHEAWLIALHNALHAPLMALAVTLAGMAWYRSGGGRGLALFGAGATGHSVVDILTHHDDGPLLLFPFDWSLRFFSPLSHWDVEHLAVWVSAAEGFVLGAAAAVWLAQRRLQTHPA